MQDVHLSVSRILEASRGNLPPSPGTLAPTLEIPDVVRAQNTWLGMQTEKGASFA